MLNTRELINPHSIDQVWQNLPCLPRRSVMLKTLIEEIFLAQMFQRDICASQSNRSLTGAGTRKMGNHSIYTFK